MNKLTEIQRAREKVQNANDKLAILKRRKVSTRSGEFKYWKGEYQIWLAYEQELFKLQCRSCATNEIQIGKTIMASGAFHIKAVCPNCGHNLKGTGHWVSKKVIPTEILADLQVIDNYLSNEPCAVCGERGTELHHWAPKELFGPEEAERWPQCYLCPDHHNQWHNTITTPFRTLRKREEKLHNGRDAQISPSLSQ